MKRSHIVTTLGIALSAIAVSISPVHARTIAASGTLNFTGSIVNDACVVSTAAVHTSSLHLQGCHAGLPDVEMYKVAGIESMQPGVALSHPGSITTRHQQDKYSAHYQEHKTRGNDSAIRLYVVSYY